MERVKGVFLAERHRNCLPRGGGVTFREFYGPGPAEGAGQAAELHVELLHRSFHHRYAIKRWNVAASVSFSHAWAVLVVPGPWALTKGPFS